MTPRYVLHPGQIVSKTDGQVHYIRAAQLACLYGVDMRECVIYPESREDLLRGWTDPPGAIHLYPRYNGDYSLPGGAS